MIIDFSGLKVLVTGGTRGIGKQVAKDLSAAKADVIITGTKKPEWSDKSIKFFPCDFLDKNSVDKMILFLEEEKIDVCINNAGINRISPTCSILEKDWSDVMEVNLTVPYKIIKTVCKNMKAQNFGRIVNVSSIWGLLGKEKRVSYSSSKFGLRGLTVSASAELAEHNILVNAVAPGFTLTDLTKQSLTEEEMKKLCLQIPVKRMAKTKEISSAILFLASPNNSYITGQTLAVDGGFTSV